jgi:hypothetical protein
MALVLDVRERRRPRAGFDLALKFLPYHSPQSPAPYAISGIRVWSPTGRFVPDCQGIS